MGFFVKNRELKSGSVSVVMPTGNTSVRPDDPVPGQIRYNSDICKFEYFNGANYRTIATEGRAAIDVNNFVGDGSTVSFVLSEPVDQAHLIMVFVGSLYQVPNDAYTVLDMTLTFSSPVPNGVPVNVIHNLGSTVTEGCPGPLDVSAPTLIYPVDHNIDFG